MGRPGRARSARADPRLPVRGRTRSIATQPPGGPHGVRPQERVGVAEVLDQHAGHSVVAAVADVAEHHERVAADVANLPTGDVPASDPPEHDLVVRIEQGEQGRPGPFGPGERADRGTPVGRAHLLALVAAVDPITERHPMLGGEDPVGLEEPREAPPGVHHPRGRDGPGRAPVEAARATAAPVLHRMGGGSQRGVGHHRAEDVPAAQPGQEQVGVLPPPPDAGPVGRSPVDQGVVVGQHPSPPPGVLQQHGDRPQPGAEILVVVRPCVSGDPTGGPHDRRLELGTEVAPRPHHEGPGVGDDPVRLGGPGRVAVGELHPAVQPRGLATHQGGAHLHEGLGGRHLHRVQACVETCRSDGLDVGRRSLGRAHGQVARSGRVRRGWSGGRGRARSGGDDEPFPVGWGVPGRPATGSANPARNTARLTGVPAASVGRSPPSGAAAAGRGRSSRTGGPFGRP